MTTKKAFEKAGVTNFSSNFEPWFFPMECDVEKKADSLTSQKLPRMMNNEEILQELTPGDVSLEEIAETLKTMHHSMWALFYAKDKDGVLRAVHAFWDADGAGWLVCAYSVTSRREWGVGVQVFSRSSRDTQPLSTSDPLTLGHFEKRLKAIEDWINSFPRT